MNNTILGLRTAIYRVDNMREAKKWYAAVFQTEPYFDEPFYVGFDIGGYELGLQPEENSSIEKAESVVVYWGVDNVDAEFDRFIASGAIAFEEPREVGGEIKVAKLKDPWGNIIGLIFNPHFNLKG